MWGLYFNHTWPSSPCFKIQYKFHLLKQQEKIKLIFSVRQSWRLRGRGWVWPRSMITFCPSCLTPTPGITCHGLWLVNSEHVTSILASDWSIQTTWDMTWILASDWSTLVTWPQYWPLIDQFISRETQKDIVNVGENYNLLWIVFRDGDAKRYRPIILNCPQLWIPCGKLPFTCYLFSGMEIVWKRRTQLWIPSISASHTQSSG
mgnify:CR=1 FL=1